MNRYKAIVEAMLEAVEATEVKIGSYPEAEGRVITATISISGETWQGQVALGITDHTYRKLLLLTDLFQRVRQKAVQLNKEGDQT